MRIISRRKFLQIAAAVAIAPAGNDDFPTNDATSSIRFFVLGDWGTGGKLQREVARGMDGKARAARPQFILSTGDNIYPDGIDSASDPQWKSKFEDIYTAESLQIPWYATLGNHDYRKNPDAQIAYAAGNPRWNMPARYYKFSKTGANTSVDFFAIDTQQIVTGKADEQLDWLAGELGKSTARWKVVFGHVMLRSHGLYGDQPAMIRALKPLFDRYGVAAYFCGHDHDLQCIKRPDDHFFQIISGAGGGSRKTTPGKYTLFSATNGGFVFCDATESVLSVEFLDKTGKSLYVCRITQ